MKEGAKDLSVFWGSSQWKTHYSDTRFLYYTGEARLPSISGFWDTNSELFGFQCLETQFPTCTPHVHFRLLFRPNVSSAPRSLGLFCNSFFPRNSRGGSWPGAWGPEPCFNLTRTLTLASLKDLGCVFL